MKIYSSYKEFKSTNNSVLTLGTFDGVHIGHQSILKKVIDSTDKNKYESVVLTFFPHPRMVLEKDHNIKLLDTITEKAKKLEALGIQHLIIQEFTKEFSNLSAEEFVRDVLVEHLHVKKIIIGYDHRFGKNRSADIHDLINYSNRYKFDVEQITAQEINEVSISSTKIRKALLEGDILTANKYLDSAFCLTGTVVKGKQLGRTIGFPTANLVLKEDYKLIPKRGSYIVSTIIDGKEIRGMMNIGINPTINSNNNQTLEVHLIDYQGDLYDQTITIKFLDYLRDEKKFDSIDALKQQLQMDYQTAKNYVTC